jgi:hypothetical protein
LRASPAIRNDDQTISVQAGSNPFALITGAAVGPVRNLSSACTAGESCEAANRPAETAVIVVLYLLEF